MPLRSFAERLGEALEHGHTSESDLAERIGVEPTVLRRWLAGDGDPSTELIGPLAEALDCDPAWLQSGEGTGPHSDEDSERAAYREKAGWSFRPEHIDGGRDFGNANIWAFDPTLDVFVREIGQNILDVVKDKSATVHMRLIALKGDRLRTFLQALRWNVLQGHLRESAKEGQKFGKVLSRGLARLDEADQLMVLRVEEHGTWGLTGAERSRDVPPEQGSNFAALCRNNLDSEKQSAGAGGAFGLGKAVLWRTSSLSTVLFNSDLAADQDGRTEGRLIGRSELSFHELDGQGFAGPGWFGDLSAEGAVSYWGNRALARDLLVSRPGGRAGTTTLILGFHDPTSEEPPEADALGQMLIDAVARHFWPALSRGVVEFAVEVADRGRPDDVRKAEDVDPVDKVPEFADLWAKYHEEAVVESLEAEGDVISKTVRLTVPEALDGSHEKLEHDAVLIVRRAADDPADHVSKPNEVAFFRGPGMVVRYRDFSNIRVGARPFHAAVLCGRAAGENPADLAAEEFLRAAEPPSHDDWRRTEEVATRYARGSGVALDHFIGEIRREIGEAVAPAARDLSDGPQGLKKLLRVSVRTEKVPGPRLTHVTANVDEEERWAVSATIAAPRDPVLAWQGKPTVIFDAETGGGRPVDWLTLEAVDGCVVEGSELTILPGRNSAKFRGVTDPASHPIPAASSAVSVEFRSADPVRFEG